MGAGACRDCSRRLLRSASSDGPRGGQVEQQDSGRHAARLAVLPLEVGNLPRPFGRAFHQAEVPRVVGRQLIDGRRASVLTDCRRSRAARSWARGWPGGWRGRAGLSAWASPPGKQGDAGNGRTVNGHGRRVWARYLRRSTPQGVRGIRPVPVRLPRPVPGYAWPGRFPVPFHPWQAAAAG